MDEEDAYLGTDKSLPIPDRSEADEGLLEKCEKYQIVEKSLQCAQMRTMVDLMDENYDVFAHTDFDLGLYNGILHHIETGDAKPIYCVPHKMAYHERPYLRAELDSMLKTGIIVESLSPWAAPILMVPK